MRRVVLVACAVFALTVWVATASADTGGNAANAKACQQGGWQTLYRSEDSSPFANEGDCVSYGAHGGTPTAIPAVFQQAASDCVGAGGSFTVGGATGPAWTCGPLPFDLTLGNTLAADCNAYRLSLTPPSVPVAGIYSGDRYVCTAS